ncbi:hypothetical protein MRB53_038719 [Persea americana]|nr:hypothetical protein MRB53_038719 [Persea americana]
MNLALYRQRRQAMEAVVEGAERLRNRAGEAVAEVPLKKILVTEEVAVVEVPKILAEAGGGGGGGPLDPGNGGGGGGGGPLNPGSGSWSSECTVSGVCGISDSMLGCVGPVVMPSPSSSSLTSYGRILAAISPMTPCAILDDGRPASNVMFIRQRRLDRFSRQDLSRLAVP